MRNQKGWALRALALAFILHISSFNLLFADPASSTARPFQSMSAYFQSLGITGTDAASLDAELGLGSVPSVSASNTWTAPQAFTSTVSITSAGIFTSSTGAYVIIGGTSPVSWGLSSDAYDNENVFISATETACVSMTGWGTHDTLIVRSEGLQGPAIVGLSDSGSPAGIFVQRHYYSSPVFQVIRDSAITDGTATAPLVDIDASNETPDSIPVAQFKRCGVTGDNGVLCWPDGSITLKTDGSAPSNPDPGRIFYGFVSGTGPHFWGWGITSGTNGTWRQLDN